ncbi:H-NS histone family protein [Ketogulonicigenium vulgare]|uniref:H-NS histone family protein n=1 Tax=Ketogulonicigenium vulgare TaxID=92945 RepID=UPI00235A0C98|nr:H-NS histone family protein [Ketogulonicigenium vulgare]
MLTLPTLDQLKTHSYAELQKLHKDVVQALSDVQAKAKNDAKAELMSRAKELGFELNQLFAGLGEEKAEKTKAASVPKYRHPENEALTWSGRGRKPSWAQDWVDSGKSLDDLKV